LTAKREAGLSSKTGHVNKLYIFALFLTITIGTIQFGYSVGSWNAANEAYAILKGWDDDQKLKNQAII